MPAQRLRVTTLINNWFKVKLEEIPEVVKLWCPFINFARCIGITSIRQIGSEPFFESQVFAGFFLFNLSIFAIFAFALIISILIFKDCWGGSSTVLVEASHNVIFYLHCQCTIAFFTSRSKSIVCLFQHWINIERSLKYKNSYQGIGNSWKLIYISTFLLSIIENIIYLLSKVSTKD